MTFHVVLDAAWWHSTVSTMRIKTADNAILLLRPDGISGMKALESIANGSENTTKYRKDEDGYIDLFNIHSKILGKIIEWDRFHKTCEADQDNIRYGSRETWKLGEWDQRFFQSNDGIVIDIFEAAWELEYHDLLDATAMYIRDRFMDNSELNASELLKHIHH